MKIISELNGAPHVFNQKDGTTFRLFAWETKQIEENQISQEMRLSEKRGDIHIDKEPKPTAHAVHLKKEESEKAEKERIEKLEKADNEKEKSDKIVAPKTIIKSKSTEEGGND